jgi:poly(3-hydroxybutyrate) depolymerase
MALSGKKVFRNSLYLFLIICFLSCCCRAKQVIGDGAGNFVFEYKIAGQVKKIPVYYYCPKELKPLSRIVFVLHGAGRSGKGYRDEWQKYAMRYNFIVLCPEFSEAEFGGWGRYNGGNVYDYDQKKYSERADWTFNVIEGLFDFVKQDRELKAEAYCIFGHSAGAQFVQRMVMFMPEARFSLAIANGAGDYTAPVFDKGFYDGLKGTCATEESIKKSFSKEMMIMMGAKDLMSKTMPKEGQFQQYDRVWKAKIFFQTAKTEAAKRQAIFNWRFMLVPDADHNNPVYAEIGSRLAANSKIYFSKPNAKEPNGTAEVNDVGQMDSNIPSKAK